MAVEKIPFMFRGPTPSRFYAQMDDHWVVDTDPRKGEVAALRRKAHGTLYFLAGYLVIPAVILVVGVIGELVFEVKWFLLASLAASLAAGLPLLLIRKTELDHVWKQPSDLFVLNNDGRLVIDGEKIAVPKGCTCRFDYRFYPSKGDQGESGFSELDFVIGSEGGESRYEVLSQVGSWALKHAKKLSSLTGFALERRTVVVR